MQRALSDIPPISSSLDANPNLNVVIAYEDFETGKHAKNTYDYLVEHLGDECQFSNQMWKFNVLGIPKLRQMATDDAANADIVMISCHGDSELPAHVVEWVNSWASANCHPIALVVLFDCETECTARIRASLSETARCAGIEFFAQPDEWPGHREDLQQRLAKALPLSDEKSLSMLVGTTYREVTPRWGINE